MLFLVFMQNVCSGILYCYLKEHIENLYQISAIEKEMVIDFLDELRFEIRCTKSIEELERTVHNIDSDPLHTYLGNIYSLSKILEECESYGKFSSRDPCDLFIEHLFLWRQKNFETSLKIYKDFKNLQNEDTFNQHRFLLLLYQKNIYFAENDKIDSILNSLEKDFGYVYIINKLREKYGYYHKLICQVIDCRSEPCFRFLKIYHQVIKYSYDFLAKILADIILDGQISMPTHIIVTLSCKNTSEEISPNNFLFTNRFDACKFPIFYTEFSKKRDEKISSKISLYTYTNFINSRKVNLRSLFNRKNSNVCVQNHELIYENGSIRYSNDFTNSLVAIKNYEKNENTESYTIFVKNAKIDTEFNIKVLVPDIKISAKFNKQLHILNFENIKEDIKIQLDSSYKNNDKNFNVFIKAILKIVHDVSTYYIRCRVCEDSMYNCKKYDRNNTICEAYYKTYYIATKRNNNSKATTKNVCFLKKHLESYLSKYRCEIKLYLDEIYVENMNNYNMNKKFWDLNELVRNKERCLKLKILCDLQVRKCNIDLNITLYPDLDEITQLIYLKDLYCKILKCFEGYKEIFKLSCNDLEILMSLLTAKIGPSIDYGHLFEEENIEDAQYIIEHANTINAYENQDFLEKAAKIQEKTRGKVIKLFAKNTKNDQLSAKIMTFFEKDDQFIFARIFSEIFIIYNECARTYASKHFCVEFMYCDSKNELDVQVKQHIRNAIFSFCDD